MSLTGPVSCLQAHPDAKPGVIQRVVIRPSDAGPKHTGTSLKPDGPTPDTTKRRQCPVESGDSVLRTHPSRRRRERWYSSKSTHVVFPNPQSEKHQTRCVKPAGNEVFKPGWETHPAGNTDRMTASQTVYRNERRSLEGRALLSIFSGSRGILVGGQQQPEHRRACALVQVGWLARHRGALFHGAG